MMLPQSDEVNRHELMPLLDAIALHCKEANTPLLTVAVSNFSNGAVDWATVRRHWKMRYGVDPGPDGIVSLHEVELQKCFDFNWDGTGIGGR